MKTWVRKSVLLLCISLLGAANVAALTLSSDSFSVGPQLAYNLFFDETPQSAMELELLVRYRFGGR